MGGVFRNAAAFGADAVLLDAACCDPLYRKAIRVSVGAALTVPFARLGVGQDLARTLAGAGLEVVALSPRGSVELSDLRYRNGVASSLDLLDAQRSLFAAQQQAVQARLLELQNRVTMYRVLGGGWAQPAQPPA